LADDISARVDSKKLELAMKKAPVKLYQRLRFRVGGSRGFLHKWIRHEIVARRLRGQALNWRSGTLANAMDSVTHGMDLGSLRFVTGAVHNAPPYAAIHEEGGTIRPNKRKWLTIPLDAAKTAAGVSRGAAPSFDDAFFIRPSSSGRAGTSSSCARRARGWSSCSS
jgi:hypothetical protein